MISIDEHRYKELISIITMLPNFVIHRYITYNYKLLDYSKYAWWFTCIVSILYHAHYLKHRKASGTLFKADIYAQQIFVWSMFLIAPYPMNVSCACMMLQLLVAISLGLSYDCTTIAGIGHIISIICLSCVGNIKSAAVFAVAFSFAILRVMYNDPYSGGIFHLLLSYAVYRVFYDADAKWGGLD